MIRLVFICNFATLDNNICGLNFINYFIMARHYYWDLPISLRNLDFLLKSFISLLEILVTWKVFRSLFAFRCIGRVPIDWLLNCIFESGVHSFQRLFPVLHGRVLEGVGRHNFASLNPKVKNIRNNNIIYINYILTLFNF